MKNTLITGLIAVLLPLSGFSQAKGKEKGPSVHISTSFNYYQSVKPYEFLSERTAYYNDLILNFITKNSGTFILEGDSLNLERTFTSKLPSQIAGIGASLQIRQANGLFHEFSLTKLSFTKSSQTIIYAFRDTSGNLVVPRSLGYDEGTATVGIRYELGKYFGKNKNARLRFGLSGGIEPTWYFYKRNSYSVQEYPIKANLFTLDISVIPMLSASISKKVGLDFKLIPNILMADAGKVIEEDPTKTIRQQAGLRNYKSPDITWAFSIILRYTVKESVKK